MKPNAPLFATGSLIGFIGYTVIQLLPGTLTTSRMVAIELLIASVVLIGLALTINFHKRLFRTPTPIVLRDACCTASLGYFIFVIAPQAFWIYTAIIAWFLGTITASVAASAIIMRDWKTDDRTAPANRLLAGLICGIVIPKLMIYNHMDREWMIHSGLVITLLLVLRIHVYARRDPGYRAPFSVWHSHDLWRDREASGLIAVSAAWGAIIGILLRENAHLGPSLIGIVLYMVFSRKIFRVFTPWRAAIFAIHVASISLLLDGLLWSEPVLSIYSLGFSAALIFGAIRADAFTPILPLSFAEQMSVHHWGSLLGFALISAGVYLVETEAYRLVGGAFALLSVAFVSSFLKNRQA